jgi:hypothetical protein
MKVNTNNQEQYESCQEFFKRGMGDQECNEHCPKKIIAGKTKQTGLVESLVRFAEDIFVFGKIHFFIKMIKKNKKIILFFS